jgi:hypothetical protein
LHLLIKQTLKKHSSLFLLNRLEEVLQNIAERHMINLSVYMKGTNEPVGKRALCYLHSQNHNAINKGHLHTLSGKTYCILRKSQNPHSFIQKVKAYQRGEEVHYLMMLPVTRIILLGMNECMNVDWWNYTERSRPLVLGEKPVPVPLRPPQSSH